MRVVAVLTSRDDTPVQVALELIASAPGSEVIALRLSQPLYEDHQLLLRALERGATRALRLWDEVLAGVDYLGQAIALAKAVRALSADLVLTNDAPYPPASALGPALAERLDRPHLCGVLSVERTDDETLLVRRRTLSGIQNLRGPQHSVLCLLARPRTPPSATPLQGETEVLTFSQIGLSAAELSHRKRVRALHSNVPKAHHKPLPFTKAADLLERLRKDHLLRSGGGG